MTETADTEAQQAALEAYASKMSAEDFDAFTARVRPPDEALAVALRAADPTDRRRATMASIAAKRAKMPKVDANGYRANGHPSTRQGRRSNGSKSQG